MKLIVGLGNPGQQYDQTRHNAGFLVVDELARRHAVGSIAKARFQSATLDAALRGERVLLMKPTTFMNLSGRSVGEAVRFFKLDPAADLLVILDDLALPVGQIRVRATGGAGGHNGLKDIDRALGGAGYPRVRVGIGKTPRLVKQEDWVLSRFTADERPDVDRSVKEAADAVEAVFSDGVEAAMNRFNRRVAEDSGGGKPQDDVHPGWTRSE